ncbi:hypothetical protein NVP1244A_048 [Vibrio phage 1.244.A._10N.261.54.C3]|nr:hypothetical protein NVP1244A_048 [Vibrio phage 1.244.A._10N.261.54.C3]AUR98676.1 hypothetical protein NVP1255O_048 [Vibrio phage 1.255.O._10N.286.45.F1]
MSKTLNPWPTGTMQPIGRGVRLKQLSNVGAVHIERERGITIITDELHTHDVCTTSCRQCRIVRDCEERTGVYSYMFRGQGKSNIIGEMWRYQLELQFKAEELLDEARLLEARLFYRKSNLTVDGFISIAAEHLAIGGVHGVDYGSRTLG